MVESTSETLKSAAKAFINAIEAAERLQARADEPSAAEISATFGAAMGAGAALSTLLPTTGAVLIRPNGESVVFHLGLKNALEIPTLIDLREPVAPPAPPVDPEAELKAAFASYMRSLDVMEENPDETLQDVIFERVGKASLAVREAARKLAPGLTIDIVSRRGVYAVDASGAHIVHVFGADSATRIVIADDLRSTSVPLAAAVVVDPADRV